MSIAIQKNRNEEAILIVDDGSPAREMYKAQLEEAGYAAPTATDGIKAINAAFSCSWFSCRRKKDNVRFGVCPGKILEKHLFRGG